jgi:hypothetical protein
MGVVDRRADVFAVGVMLWELLAGHRMWQGMGEAHIVHHLAAGMPIPNLPAQPGRPPVLDRICARALTINPGDRYATAAELQNDLEGVLAGIGDSHVRVLGQVVTAAFSEARAEREALIARALSIGESAPAASPAWAREIDALLPILDGEFDVTVVDAAVAPQPREPPPRPPPPARRGGQVGVTVTTIGLAAVGLALVVTAIKQQQLSTPASVSAAAVSGASVSTTRVSEVAVPPVQLDSDVRAAVEVVPAPLAVPVVARRAKAARHADRAPGEDDARGQASPFELTIEKRRPASLRAIDEGDPFK